jgi:hypothetical protein
LVGPVGGKGEESFDFIVCTPGWFSSNMNGKLVVSGRNYLFMQKFDYPALEQFVRNYCSQCVGKTWREVADKVSRIGKWEFEDYRA